MTPQPLEMEGVGGVEGLAEGLCLHLGHRPGGEARDGAGPQLLLLGP